MFGLRPAELVVITLGLALPILGFHLVLTAWGRWVVRRQGGGAGWQLASWLPVAAFVIGLAAFVVVGSNLTSMHELVRRGPTADKASLMTASMRSVMRATMSGLSLAVVMDFVAGALFIFGSSRAPHGSGSAAANPI